MKLLLPLSLALLAMPLASCMTQKTTVCFPSDKGERKTPGTIWIQPVWTKGSLETYLRWFKEDDGKGRVKEFHDGLNRFIQHEMGLTFPKVDIPIGKDVARVLSLSGSHFQDPEYAELFSERVGDDPVQANRPGDDARVLKDAVALIADAVNDAITRHNSTLATTEPDQPGIPRMAGPLIQQITYVVEDGVTYCVYGTGVVKVQQPQGAANKNTQPNWWWYYWQDEPGENGEEGEWIGVFLDIYVVVADITPEA